MRTSLLFLSHTIHQLHQQSVRPAPFKFKRRSDTVCSMWAWCLGSTRKMHRFSNFNHVDNCHRIDRVGRRSIHRWSLSLVSECLPKVWDTVLRLELDTSDVSTVRFMMDSGLFFGPKILIETAALITMKLTATLPLGTMIIARTWRKTWEYVR